jgi:hypothetical protein
MRHLWKSLLLSWISAQMSLPGAEPRPYKVGHSPREPRSAQTVLVTVTAAPVNGSALILQYQPVDPGHYIELADAAYQDGWISVPMNDSGRRGDTVAGDGVFTAELPAALQRHRRLIRYRVADGGRVVAPAADDTQPNFAYFVYDGVPAWPAAINPRSEDPSLRIPVTFSAALMNSVQVYQFIARKSSVERTTWHEPADLWNPQARHEYKHTGTVIAGGKVYDHVRFRARGGEWRHAMGKNMWKFDFKRGHHLQAHDNFNLPYNTKWEKLNLGACIQQGNYHRRGEHGLFEAVTYGLFNLAGVPAPHTHYVHLRIIDEPDENPVNQYEGDFWGLYLATEEIDDNFLEEHRLPDGNLYKWDFGRPKPEHFADGAVTNRQDVLQFVRDYQRPQSDDWWRRNVDLPRYFSYRSVLECVHHYDIANGKNYFYYFHTTARQWIVLPWDVDLTWKNNMYGGGQEPFWRAGLLRQPQFNIEYQNRLREIRDLLFNPEQTGALIDEYAAAIADPAGGRSFAEADRAKWDYHPIMNSRWVNPRKAGQGQFYLESPTKDFRGMVRLMKDYIDIRGRWCDSNLLTDPGIPPAPTVRADDPLNFTSPALRFHASQGTDDLPPDIVVQWRLAEVSLGRVSRPLVQRHYEIQALWEATGQSTTTIPTIHFKPGRTYRVRARACDSNGRCGHWSEAWQFSVNP